MKIIFFCSRYKLEFQLFESGKMVFFYEACAFFFLVHAATVFSNLDTNQEFSYVEVIYPHILNPSVAFGLHFVMNFEFVF